MLPNNWNLFQESTRDVTYMKSRYKLKSGLLVATCDCGNLQEYLIVY